MMLDPARVIADEAIKAANGNSAPQTVPALQLNLENCRIDVADAQDQQGAKMKIIVVTHASGGMRVVIPLPAASARTAGNALCDRPNVVIP